jgi:hypothetical protein
MNNLSWLLYFGDIVNNIQGLCGAVIAIGGIASICLTAAFFSTLAGYQKEEHQVIAKWLRRILTIISLAGLIVVFVPSKQTIYLIAASETGEQVLNSPTGQKAVAAINRYLDEVGREDDKDDNKDK